MEGMVILLTISETEQGQTFTLTAQMTCPLFSLMSRVSDDENCFHCCYYTPNQKAVATIQCVCDNSQHQITRKRLLPYNVFVTIRNIKHDRNGGRIFIAKQCAL